ncbi:MAG: cupin domain-containing protein [Paludibacter sp.]|nr:cupin domain-containing protein [Paludibacter sp.]
MENKSIGEKIRTLLAVKNITNEELSERSGLSADQIELVLNGCDCPSLSPLIKIARGLGVRLGTFLDDNEQLGPVVFSSEEHEVSTVNSHLTTANANLNFMPMAGNKAGRHMEPFVIDISPAKNYEISGSSHEGEEFIYVLSGKVRIVYGKETYTLHVGESIYYDSIIEHKVSVDSEEPARILAVVYTPL